MNAIAMIRACGAHQTEGHLAGCRVLLPVTSTEATVPGSEAHYPQEPMGNGAEPVPEGFACQEAG